MSDRWLKGVIYNDRLSPKDIEIKELRKDIERLNEYVSFYEDLSKKQNKEIEKLNKGYCPIKEKCNKGECDCTNEEYNQMCEENIKLDLEIERLNNIINQAIEYIEENCSEHGNEESMWFYRIINADNVLNILKGDDKE